MWDCAMRGGDVPTVASPPPPSTQLHLAQLSRYGVDERMLLNTDDPRTGDDAFRSSLDALNRFVHAYLVALKALVSALPESTEPIPEYGGVPIG
jgi:hypothetical protein